MDDLVKENTQLREQIQAMHESVVQSISAYQKTEEQLRNEIMRLNGLSPAAILGKEGGKKSKRAITPEQQAKMQEARKAKKCPLTQTSD